MVQVYRPRKKLTGTKRKVQALMPYKIKKNILSRRPKEEQKYYDSLRSNITVVATVASSEVDDTTALCLNAPLQGAGQKERIGNKIMIHSVQVNYSVNLITLSDQADAATSVSVKIYLILDKQTNLLQFNAEDVYEDTAGLDILSNRDMEYTNRFQVLAVETIDLDYTNSHGDGTNTGSIAGQRKVGTIYKKVAIPVQYKVNTGDITSVIDNSLHLMAIASDASRVNLSWQSRIRFTG